MQPKVKFHVFIYVIAASVVFIVGGIVLIVLRTNILDYTVNTILTLTPNSVTYDMWSTNQFPVNFDVYFFNWTNPEDFYNTSTKPIMKEIGPFRFGETIQKVGVVFHDNGTVSYNVSNTWLFNEEESVANVDCPITTINPVAVSAAYTARTWNYLVKKGLSFSLSTLASVSHTKSVRQTMFDGYEEPLLEMAHKLPFLKNLPPFDKFAWFYERNGTADFNGRFNIGTGESDPLGTLYNWNYWSATPYYKGKCSTLQESAGEFFPQNANKDSITLFNPEMCRNLVADFVEETNVDNINGYKYVLGDSFLDNGTIVPENECSCTGECVPYGAVNVSSCRYGSPGFVSLPHFYKAHPYYNDRLSGMNPNKEKHEFHITLEPRTGLPLQVAARIQLNLLVQEIPGIEMFENINTVFFPVLWFQKVVKVPDDLVFKLKLLLNLTVILVYGGAFLICSGLFTIAFVCYKICNMRIIEKKNEKTYLSRELVPLNTDKITI